MKTRDDWRKKAKKTNDPLSWTAYRYFRQEVKREIRIAEKEFVAEQILVRRAKLFRAVIKGCNPTKYAR